MADPSPAPSLMKYFARLDAAPTAEVYLATEVEARLAEKDTALAKLRMENDTLQQFTLNAVGWSEAVGRENERVIGLLAEVSRGLEALRQIIQASEAEIDREQNG